MNREKDKLKQNTKTNLMYVFRNIDIDWGRQGKVFMVYLVIMLGYFGIIVNTIMFDQYGNWISYVDMDPTILIWPYKTYNQSYYLPLLLLFSVCFLITYKEDIPYYGIKASIWLVPFIIAEGFMFYFMMFGLSLEPFILLFARGEGYLNGFILFIVVLSGAICGMKFKLYLVNKKNRIYEKKKNKEIKND